MLGAVLAIFVSVLSIGLVLGYGVNGLSRGLRQGAERVVHVVKYGLPRAPAPVASDPETELADALSLLYGPLAKCTCSQRGDPLPIIVRDTLDGSEYVIRVVCTTCWQTATNATPQPDWPHDVYPRPVPWQDTLPPVDAPGPRLAALRDLLATKREAIDRLANGFTTDAHGCTLIPGAEHAAYQALQAETVDLRREIVTANRADWEARGLCSECGRSKDDGHIHVDAVTGERADKVTPLVSGISTSGVMTRSAFAHWNDSSLRWGDPQAYEACTDALSQAYQAQQEHCLLCTEPEYEDRYKHGEPEPVRCVCANCGRTPYEHGEYVSVDDPETGEHLGAVRRGDDGETHLA